MKTTAIFAASCSLAFLILAVKFLLATAEMDSAPMMFAGVLIFLGSFIFCGLITYVLIKS